eukprot:m.109905 g.109905  ORF g.109905 m.109905 type:complete len:603 (+) comp27997_c2_seq2:218-2026(+)
MHRIPSVSFVEMNTANDTGDTPMATRISVSISIQDDVVREEQDAGRSGLTPDNMISTSPSPGRGRISPCSSPTSSISSSVPCFSQFQQQQPFKDNRDFETPFGAVASRLRSYSLSPSTSISNLRQQSINAHNARLNVATRSLYRSWSVSSASSSVTSVAPVSPEPTRVRSHSQSFVQPLTKYQGVFLYEGWLTKIGFKSGKWQRRWFTLKRGDASCNSTAILTYTRAPGSYRVLGQIVACPNTLCSKARKGDPPLPASVLSTGYVCAPIPQHCIILKPPPEPDPLMSRSGNSRVFYVAADTDLEADTWVRWIRTIQGGSPPPTDANTLRHVEPTSLPNANTNANANINTNSPSIGTPSSLQYVVDTPQSVGLASALEQLHLDESRYPDPDLVYDTQSPPPTFDPTQEMQPSVVIKAHTNTSNNAIAKTNNTTNKKPPTNTNESNSCLDYNIGATNPVFDITNIINSNNSSNTNSNIFINSTNKNVNNNNDNITSDNTDNITTDNANVKTKMKTKNVTEHIGPTDPSHVQSQPSSSAAQSYQVDSSIDWSDFHVVSPLTKESMCEANVLVSAPKTNGELFFGIVSSEFANVELERPPTPPGTL